MLAGVWWLKVEMVGWVWGYKRTLVRVLIVCIAGERADLKVLRVGKPAEAMRTASSTPPARSCSSAYSGTSLPGLDSGLGFIHLQQQLCNERLHVSI